MSDNWDNPDPAYVSKNWCPRCGEMACSDDEAVCGTCASEIEDLAEMNRASMIEERGNEP